MKRAMKKEDASALLRRGWADPRRGELSLFAANGAYYLFLSLGPLTALVLSALPYTPVTEQRLLTELQDLVPPALRQLVLGIVRDVYAGSAAALPLSMALELWSGARFLAGVTRGLGDLAGIPPGGYFRRRALGAVYTAALVLFVLGNMMLLRFGERLLLAVCRRYPGGGVFWALVLRLRPLLLLAGLTAGNVLLFRCGLRDTRLRASVPGAVFSAAAGLLFSRLYSWALERFGLFGVYGSIAAAAASLCWMYGSLYLLFLGAWINTLLPEREKSGAPRPEKGRPVRRPGG